MKTREQLLMNFTKFQLLNNAVNILFENRFNSETFLNKLRKNYRQLVSQLHWLSREKIRRHSKRFHGISKTGQFMTFIVFYLLLERFKIYRYIHMYVCVLGC